MPIKGKKPRSEHWKHPEVLDYDLAPNQHPLEPIEDQRKCDKCQKDDFKILIGKSPKDGIEKYLLVCSHCRRAKWLQGRRNL